MHLPSGLKLLLFPLQHLPAATTKALRSIFSTHGLPEILVFDNGSVFTSNGFKTFIKENGIRHITTAPYHPAGSRLAERPYHPAGSRLAERAVQTFKEELKKDSTVDMDTQLSKFLFGRRYGITPHATTGMPPVELLMQRKPHSCWDLAIRPQLSTTVFVKQTKQKRNHDKSAPVHRIWGPLTYDIELEDGRIVTRHIDNLRKQLIPSMHFYVQSDLTTPH